MSTAEPLILSVETATLSGSVALSRGEQVLAAFAGDSGVSHSNTLLNDIDKLLKESQVDLSDIDLFAVATGPGSFTGLRIGIATVKALAATLERPCAGIPTLQAVALAAGESHDSIALLSAGRGEVFAQLFSVTKDGFVTALDQATHISPQKLIEKYGSLDDVLWCGDGAIANKALIERESRGRIAPQIAVLARQIASLALTRFREKQLEQPDALQAIYVRPSDAELKA
jgi:tRNA threonylcarbamoyladenosine biosynthesis protein TsaB